ncbi:glycine--tRNA ligase-like isoform X2 [Watersipora subatra]|uniref:glycine--tRNA ligase-like isoform X2 n=1 Tax=Watersipora subatra TaxID=2589382 RepID=UPI00355C3B99
MICRSKHFWLIVKEKFNRAPSDFLLRSLSSTTRNIRENRLALDLVRQSSSCILWRNFATRTNWGVRKRTLFPKLFFIEDRPSMSAIEHEETLAPLRLAVQEQGNLVRKLKEEKADPVTIKAAVTELKARIKSLELKVLELEPKEEKFDRLKMEDLLKQKFFYDISFSIYGGVAGQYDFGPLGCAVKNNIIDEWRKFFVLEEGIFEVNTSCLTPEPVLQASGHMEKFADYMVKDLKNGECFRVDHLIQTSLEKFIVDSKDREAIAEASKLISQLDNMKKDDYQAIIDKYSFKSPLTGNDLSEPIEFNLMFSTNIGPAGLLRGFLRPETAQGIFVNFKRLLEFNGGKLPFAAAQIGKAFRNEISPRAGLIRVREFDLAEIEHFVDPDDKAHPKFDDVQQVELPLLSACNQMDGKSPVSIAVGEAVSKGLIANQTLGYFMTKTFLFLKHIGINMDKVRFRQHMSNEMAHYASDCWDAECKTSYGWVECVGHADRSAFDLTHHTNATNVKLVAEKKLASPKKVKVMECLPNKAKIGKAFKQDSKVIITHLAQIGEEEASALKEQLATGSSVTLSIDNKRVTLSAEMLTVKEYEKTVHVEEIIPSVIEPAFGIGRIMYSLFEHSFREREGDEQRTYLSLPPSVAPYKCSVLPLSGNTEFAPFTRTISSSLRQLGVSHKVDESSGSIGRRYARTDQIAIPLGVTIDFDTLKEPHSVTLRERDSLEQVRLPVNMVASVVNDVARGVITWEDVKQTYPKFEQQEATK